MRGALITACILSFGVAMRSQTGIADSAASFVSLQENQTNPDLVRAMRKDQESRIPEMLRYFKYMEVEDTGGPVDVGCMADFNDRRPAAVEVFSEASLKRCMDRCLKREETCWGIGYSGMSCAIWKKTWTSSRPTKKADSNNHHLGDKKLNMGWLCYRHLVDESRKEKKEKKMLEKEQKQKEEQQREQDEKARLETAQKRQEAEEQKELEGKSLELEEKRQEEEKRLKVEQKRKEEEKRKEVEEKRLESEEKREQEEKRLMFERFEQEEKRLKLEQKWKLDWKEEDERLELEQKAEEERKEVEAKRADIVEETSKREEERLELEKKLKEEEKRKEAEEKRVEYEQKRKQEEEESKSERKRKKAQEDIEERLAKANAMTGKIQISLAWDGPDDLDLHVTPPNKRKIWYGHKEAGGGRLDVDANAGSSRAFKPVENVFFDDPEKGEYIVKVSCYEKRTTEEVKWTVAISKDGKTVMKTGKLSKSKETSDAYTFKY